MSRNFVTRKALYCEFIQLKRSYLCHFYKLLFAYTILKILGMQSTSELLSFVSENNVLRTVCCTVRQGRNGTSSRRSVYGGLFAHDISRIRMRGACRACVHTFIANRCTNTSLLLIVFKHVILRDHSLFNIFDYSIVGLYDNCNRGEVSLSSIPVKCPTC